MKKDQFWNDLREKAVLDRQSFLDAWLGTGNEEVLAETRADIEQIKALKGLSFAQAVKTEPKRVFTAMVFAQYWYESLAHAQVGSEKKLATSMFVRVRDLRMKLFGPTALEQMTSNKSVVAVPIHKVQELIDSGLSATEFLATLDAAQAQAQTHSQDQPEPQPQPRPPDAAQNKVPAIKKDARRI